ncbi:MAG: beta-lactamase family protein [Bacteroidetes bacterium]|nr:beta-lactamase family protein [Bacteroidota bacterium]
MRTVFRIITIILIQLFVVSGSSGQGLPTASPEECGFSSERLQRIDAVMQSYVEENKLPGMLTLVARKGRVVHLGSYGRMRSDQAMETDMIGRIASMTKPITSTAVMILYEEGHLLLTDPVSKYLPQFENLKVYVSGEGEDMILEDPERQMTIHDLLTHTSGLTYGFFGDTPVDKFVRNSSMSSKDLEHMVNTLGGLPLLFQPGDHWNYSVSTDVLGYLVEVVSGSPFDQFIEEQILGPLGMFDTGFFVAKDKLNRVMPVYSLDEEGALVAGQLNRVPTKTPELLSGGGGLYSTISDYARFAQMILNGGELDGARILGRKTVDLMLSNHLSEEQMARSLRGRGVGFGLGFSVVTNLTETRIIGSNGAASWAGINNTFFSVDPEEDLVWILMTQFSPFKYYKIQDEFKVLVYQALID